MLARIPALIGKAVVAIVAISLLAMTAAAQAQNESRKPDSDAKVAALIRQLEGSDVDRREEALDALLKMEPMTPAAIAALSQAMKNPDDAVRQYAVQVLACSGADAIPALALAIDDSDKQVRMYAVEGLGSMAGQRGCYQTRGTPADAAAAGAKVWPVLISAFKDAHEDVRSEATFQFYRDKPASVPLLRHALKDSDAKVRLGAAKALWQMGPEAKDACGDDLVLALTDPDSDVRDQALTTLTYVDPTRKELLPILIQRLADPDSKVREKAVEQLTRMKSNAEGAVPALAHLLATEETPALPSGAPNIYPAFGIIQTLGAIGTANAALVLGQVLTGEIVPKMESFQRPPGAVIALGPLFPPVGTPQHPPGPIRAPSDRRLEPQSPQANLRRSAALSIWRSGANGVAALSALERALTGDQDPSVRAPAAQAIGVLGASGAPGVPALAQALSDDNDADVRITAACSIGELGPAGAQGLPALLRALGNDQEADVRIGAVYAIGELGPGAAPAIPALVAALGTTVDENRASIRPYPCVFRSLADTAGDALAKLGKPALPALIAALQSSDVNVRDRAAKAFAGIVPFPKEAIPALTVALKDKEFKVRHDAALALPDTGGEAERAANAELEREEEAKTAEKLRLQSKEEIDAPVETEVAGEKYKLELSESAPIKSQHDETGEATFLITLHRGTSDDDDGSFPPARLAIWKRTGDDKFQQLYVSDREEALMGAQYSISSFKAQVLVMGQEKEHYEPGQFVDISWQGTARDRGNEVFALEPEPFGEVEIQAADDWYGPKLRSGEMIPNGVENSFSVNGLKFKFDIHGDRDMGWHDASAGEVTGAYKIIKRMHYDAQKNQWVAAWKMVVNTAKREPLQ
jgi:HEAT repeat protein